MTARISMSDYEEATEAYMGWCPVCAAFTRECTEPDAEGYDCPECEEHKVIGAENAMIMGAFEIGD